MYVAEVSLHRYKDQKHVQSAEEGHTAERLEVDEEGCEDHSPSPDGKGGSHTVSMKRRMVVRNWRATPTKGTW